jgi:hypothetical protein
MQMTFNQSATSLGIHQESYLLTQIFLKFFGLILSFLAMFISGLIEMLLDVSTSANELFDFVD